MAKIEKIKEILSDEALYYSKKRENSLKSLKASILRSKLFEYVSNLKFPIYDSKGEIKIPGDIKPDILGENALEHKLLAITHARIEKFCRTKKHERIYDLYLQEGLETIFLDLDKRIYNTGHLGISGKREIYDELSLIFDKAKAPTLIPIFVGKELLSLHIFDRYVGCTQYYNQFQKFSPDKKPEISHLIMPCFSGPRRISILFEPEKKERELLKIY